MEGLHVPFCSGGSRDHIGRRGPELESAICVEVGSRDRPRREQERGDERDATETPK
jgi:hypothetical protein